MSRDELEGIVERDLPGYKLASTEAFDADRPSHAEPDDVTPDIDALRAKYLGTDEAREEAPRPRRRKRSRKKRDDEASDGANEENTDDELVAVQPKEAADPFDHAVRPKTIVISGEDHKIVGSQG
jgi:hypothetical protein